MKKLLFLSAIALTLAAGACNKCSTCSYTYSIAGEDSTIQYAEVCGDKVEIDEYENSVRAAAAQNNGIVTCSQEKQ